MKLIKYSVNTGLINMQSDEELLNSSIKNNIKEPIFRLYGWYPKCVSLGKNQKEFSLDNNISVVKRLTGGRALLHDNEITYSCVFPIEAIPKGESVINSYKYISQIFINFFKIYDLDFNFGTEKAINTNHEYCMLLATGADVCYQNKKIIGSAQCRKQGYILQHGSILYNYDKEYLEQLFNEEITNITSLKEILPNISKEKIINDLENYLITL